MSLLAHNRPDHRRPTNDRPADGRISVLMLDGHSVYSRDVGHCLGQAPNIDLHVLSTERFAPLRFSRYAKSFAIRPPYSYLETIRDACVRHSIDVVLPVDEEAVKFLALNEAAIAGRARLHLVPTMKNIDLGMDKWMLARYLQANGIPHPGTLLASEPSSGPESCASAAVLLKPRSGGNGKGIKRFANVAEAITFLESSGLTAADYILQDRLPGYDIDCSVLCREGRILAFTAQKPMIQADDVFKPAGFIEILHDESVLELVTRLMAATGWSGIAHIDCRYDERDRQIKVIEINPRYWGTITGSLAAGVNFPYLACLSTLDIDFPLPEYENMPYVTKKTAVSQWKRVLGMQAPAIRFSQTAWNYVVDDPAPEISEACGSLFNLATRH